MLAHSSSAVCSKFFPANCTGFVLLGHLLGVNNRWLHLGVACYVMLTCLNAPLLGQTQCQEGGT